MATAERPDARAVGLALAGGGPAGAVYEIGALRAIDEAFEGIDLHRLAIYVGVSAGAFVASCLANAITTSQLCRAIIADEAGEYPFAPEHFLAPAFGAFARSGLRVPRLLMDGVWDVVKDPSEHGLFGSLNRLTWALPVGLLRNDPIRTYLKALFSEGGRSDHFRELSTKLLVVATDLDSATAALFGGEGLDHVPISTAVQASTALPGLYPPVEIDGRHYVDGVLLKTVHASVALDEGAGLVICVNPIVPFDTHRSVEHGMMRRGRLADRGLITVLSQTLRTIVHSRMKVGLASYEHRYAGRDILLFEPQRDDYDMFFGNVFSFANRVEICEHAYKSTRHKLWRDRAGIEPILRRNGIRLRTDVLADRRRDLRSSVGLPTSRDQGRTSVAQLLDDTLGDLESLL
jgi:NTE family protein